MKILFLLTISFIFLSAIHSDCVEEFTAAGIQLKNKTLDTNKEYFVEIDGRFIPIAKAKLNPEKKYLVQVLAKSQTQDYNDKYLKYYDYKRLNDYLNQKLSKFQENKYQLEVIGQSVEGRKLYALFPKVFEKDKKTVVMFARHHGDEGTANWIVEGFLNSVFAANSPWLNKFQLVLYPMVNPDGAERKSRYNANSRDLNRTWNSKNADEVLAIRDHLENLRQKMAKKSVVAVLDMHGSFTQDFIYRVNRFFIDLDFFTMQGNFINHLAIHDHWQKGAFQLSDGHPGMSRIFLVKKYRDNALTHETIRNIAIKNPQGRTIDSLKNQGVAIYKTILEMYSNK